MNCKDKSGEDNIGKSSVLHVRYTETNGFSAEESFLRS
jgi:hypothetical protein